MSRVVIEPRGRTCITNADSLQQDELEALKERNRELELGTKVRTPPSHAVHLSKNQIIVGENNPIKNIAMLVDRSLVIKLLDKKDMYAD